MWSIASLTNALSVSWSLQCVSLVYTITKSGTSLLRTYSAGILEEARCAADVGEREAGDILNV